MKESFWMNTTFQLKGCQGKPRFWWMSLNCDLLQAVPCATFAPAPDASADDFAAFVDVIYPKLFQFLFSFARNEHDAKELTQRVITRLSQNPFRAEQIQNIDAWCYGVARNEFLNHRRWVERNPVRFDKGDKAEGLLETMIGGEAAADVIEDRSDLLKFLCSRIPADAFAIMELRAEGLKFHEISQLLNQPITTIQTKLRAAQVEANKIYREEISRSEKKSLRQFLIPTPFNTFYLVGVESKEEPWWRQKEVKPASLPKDFVLRINGLERAIPLSRHHPIIFALGFNSFAGLFFSFPPSR